MDRLALFFKALVERFGPHAQWEDPYYPGEARLAEYEEFLRAYDMTAGIAALLIDWAREGGARRFEDELEDAWARLCHADALKTGFITTADLPVNKTVEGHTVH